MIDDDARRQEPDTMSAVPDDTMQDNAALRDELSGMRRLHALQVSLAAQADARIALQEITALACAFARTDCGCVQLVSAHNSEMELRVYRGHDERSTFVQQFLKDGFQATCDTVRRERRQLVIEDIETFTPLKGTPDYEAALCSGIRAAQFTPLFNRAGGLLGLLGTQFTVPYRPAEHELRLLELLAWTAADYIERHRGELALRMSESRLAALSAASSEVHYRMSADWDEMHQLTAGARTADAMATSRSWIMDYIPAEDQALVRSRIDAGIRARSAIVFEHRVRRADGSIAWMATKVATFVVNQRSARNWNAAEIRLAEETAERTWAALERARAQGALLESEERYRVILESALDYAIFTTDTRGHIQTWPPGAEAVFGWTAEEAIGQHIAMTFVAEDRLTGVPQREIEQAHYTGGAPNVRWHQCKDGRHVFIEGATRPLRNGSAEPLGYLKIGQDVTRRRQWEDRQQVLLAELQHRTRNLMGVVRVVFNRTQRSSKTIAELALIYNDRLDALARVQGLLSRLNEGDRILFDELIRVELSAMGAIDAQGQGDRVTLDGPAGVRLRSSTVQTFALALHELATNANKYGALAQAGGQLRVRWRLLGTAKGTRLHIEWSETGVHMPAPGEAAQGSAGRDDLRAGAGRRALHHRAAGIAEHASGQRRQLTGACCACTRLPVACCSATPAASGTPNPQQRSSTGRRAAGAWMDG